MNEADSLRVACPECGKRLRVKAALDGKRLKCPGCSASFQVNADPNRDEDGEQAKSKPFPWLLVGVGSGAVVLVALALVLWLGARSEAAGLKAQLAESGDKAAKTNEAVEDLRKQLEMAKKSLGAATTDIEDLKKKQLAETRKAEKEAASQVKDMDKRLAEALAENKALKTRLDRFEEAKRKAQEAERKAEEARRQAEETRLQAAIIREWGVAANSEAAGGVLVVEDTGGRYRAFASTWIKAVKGRTITLGARARIATGTGKGSAAEMGAVVMQALKGKAPYFVGLKGGVVAFFDKDKEATFRDLAGGPDAIASGTVDAGFEDVSIVVKSVAAARAR
jgi:hypothetical protein